MSEVRINVVNFIEHDLLRKDMSYSLADLNTAMMEQGSLFVHYGVLLAKSSKQVDSVEILLKATEAKVYRKVRDDHIASGEKVTEGQLNSFVNVNSQVIAVKKALSEAKQVETIAKIAVEGFRQRKDMLVQHGSTAREELKGDLRIMHRTANAAEADAIRERAELRVLEAQKRKSEE
jgi:hypothetical protein